MRRDVVLRALHLCAGYGGFELGLRLAGVDCRTVCHVERDAYAAAVLVARMDESRLDQAPVWSDLVTFDGAAWRGRVDIVTAGFPCQPFSAAGKRLGVDDDRWLWPDIARIIRDVEPRFVFLENVPGVVRAGLAHVLGDLAALGFDAEWGLLSAAAVGAPHKRERFWLVGHAAGRESPPLERAEDSRADTGRAGGRPRPVAPAGLADTTGERERKPHLAPCTVPRSNARADLGGRGFPPHPDDADGWAEWIAAGGPGPAVRRSTDGPPVGLADALHLGGNGLVPQCAAEAWRQLTDRLGGV